MGNKELEKIPPQNIEAEQALLGCLLIDEEAIYKVADILAPDDFYKEIHEVIYQTILDLFGKQEPIDTLSVANRLEENKKLDFVGGRSYLIHLSNAVPNSSNVKNYAQIVQKKATLRKLIQASTKTIEDAYEEDQDAVNILDKAEQRIFAISKKFLQQKFIPIKETLAEAFERIDALQKGKEKIRGVPTGFINLDEKLAGLQPSDFILLASRPSVGKSSLALDFARYAAVEKKIPVGIFSLEMSRDQVVDRLICAEAGINLWQLRTGHISSKDNRTFKNLNKSLSKLSEAPIFIDDSPTANIIEIRTKARRLQAEHNVGLLIIDYLQLMESPNVRDNRVQEVSEISRAMKSIARELKIPVLALSQLSRATEVRVPAIPKLADLRESGCLTGDTLITNINTGRQLTMKDLAKRKKQTPIPIISLDKNYKLRSDTITKVFPSGKKIIFELTTKSGRKIKASANHPFFKLEGWTRLDHLKNGDFIAVPRNITIKKPKNPLNKKELILLAHLLGDGCIVSNQPYHYTSADKKNLQIVKKTAKDLFGINGRMVKQKNWYHLYLPSPYRLTRGKYHPITNWFTRLNIHPCHSWEKVIPEAIFQSSENYIALFLKHLWSTDGNISWKKMPNRKPLGNIYYASSSKILAEQVQHLLLRLDIQSTIKLPPLKKAGYHQMYHVHIQSSTEQLKFLSRVGIYGEKNKIITLLTRTLKKVSPNPNNDIIPKEAWQIIIKPAKEKLGLSWREVSKILNTAYCGTKLYKSGLSRERMLRLYNNGLKNIAITNLANSDILWDQVISIKKIGSEETYDATVKSRHNFIANDIIVHNSLEQDADVVLFIYRKIMDRGIKVCPEEEKNVAEIYIAKHRHGPAGVMVPLYFDEEKASFRNLTRQEEPF